MLDAKTTLKDKKVIYFRESFLQSLGSDVITIGFLCFSFWFNGVYVGGSFFFNALIFIMFISLIKSKFYSKAKIFTDFSELLEYITDKSDAEKADKESTTSPAS